MCSSLSHFGVEVLSEKMLASQIPGLDLNAIDISSTFTTKLFQSVVYFYLTSSYSVQLKLASSPALSMETALPVFISSVWKINDILSDITVLWHFCSITAVPSYLGTSLAFGHHRLLVFSFLVISLFANSPARHFFKDWLGHLFLFTWYSLLR